MVSPWEHIKVGDLVSFDYESYDSKILAVVLDIMVFPEDDPTFISYLYIYAVREQGYVFIEFGEVKNLEVL